VGAKNSPALVLTCRVEGLIFFRINPLGAYLFGQAGEYESPLSLDDPLFSIDPELVIIPNPAVYFRA